MKRQWSFLWRALVQGWPDSRNYPQALHVRCAGLTRLRLVASRQTRLGIFVYDV